jgi:hypothetical protein
MATSEIVFKVTTLTKSMPRLSAESPLSPALHQQHLQGTPTTTLNKQLRLLTSLRVLINIRLIRKPK